MLTWNDVKGVGPARRSALEEAGLFAPEQLVERLPVGYRDTTLLTPTGMLRPGTEAAFEGIVASQARTVRIQGRVYVTATINDGSGAIKCTWFSAPWMAKNLPTGKRLRFYGRIVRQKTGQVLCVSPSIVDEPCIQPVYRPLQSVPPKTMRTLIDAALSAGRFDDVLPETFRNRYNLCPRQFALRQAHFPSSHEALADARRRLAFEELALFQTHLQGLRVRSGDGARIPLDDAAAEAFWASLPFAPTGAQRRVLDEIRQDLAAPAPMARLVQGDVGCGKTAIAFGALYLAAKAGFQGVLMAPTEVLAAQHIRTAERLLAPLGITCALLTGKMPARARREAQERAASGEAQVIIGTHALISEGVTYKNLGLAITDEQHRFGVRQRTLLGQKTAGSPAPNVLVLSATPIPRTLSLILFGDLNVSIVDELPPGRTPVKTHIVPEAKRNGLYGFLRAQASAGRQAYIVCPLVTESEMVEAVSVEQMYETLRTGPLASLRVGLVHGKQKSVEQEEILAWFSRGELDVLVATTVVEVGVDVPNASVMVIENADRFGLSQLHQLRGRVGRGAAESYCFLMAPSNERLDALVSTTDGFVIAQKDLEQRGPGEWFGTRQHGAPEMPGAALGGDVRLLEETQQAIRQLLADPQRAYEAELMREAALTRFGKEIDAIGLN